MKYISVREIIEDQECFDKSLDGEVSEGILIKPDGTAYIQTMGKRLVPLKQSNIALVEYRHGGW